MTWTQHEGFEARTSGGVPHVRCFSCNITFQYGRPGETSGFLGRGHTDPARAWRVHRKSGTCRAGTTAFALLARGMVRRTTIGRWETIPRNAVERYRSLPGVKSNSRNGEDWVPGWVLAFARWTPEPRYIVRLVRPEGYGTHFNPGCVLERAFEVRRRDGDFQVQALALDALGGRDALVPFVRELPEFDDWRLSVERAEKDPRHFR